MPPSMRTAIRSRPVSRRRSSGPRVPTTTQTFASSSCRTTSSDRPRRPTRHCWRFCNQPTRRPPIWENGTEGRSSATTVRNRALPDVRVRERTHMAITGAHMLLYTTEPEALRATLRDVFGWKYVDAGHGWLIFALPPAEMGVHPAEGPTYQ